MQADERRITGEAQSPGLGSWRWCSRCWLSIAQPTAPLAADCVTVIRTEHERLRIIFHRGCCGVSALIAVPCRCARPRHVADGARSGVSISGAATIKSQSIRLLRPSGPFATGRRVGRHDEARSGSGAASQRAGRILGPAFVRRTGPCDRQRSSRPSWRGSPSRGRQSVTVAPLGGFIATPSHARTVRLARAHSRGRITSGCT